MAAKRSFRRPGDRLYLSLVDADGPAYVLARTDDVIKLAGPRRSTGHIEEVIAQDEDVAVDGLVVGLPLPLPRSRVTSSPAVLLQRSTAAKCGWRKVTEA